MEIIKNVPQPSNPLKSFNWSKIPEQKLQGTIWSELDDTKLYNVMDLESIDKIFCAYQKNGVSTEGSIEDLRTLGKNKKTMSVIDSRRAQNCTILLSKLKMSDNEITRTILSMDQQNILHIDMVEQLLKYTPSSEEAASLDMHQKELQNRADCFLYQISKCVACLEKSGILPYNFLLFVKKFSDVRKCGCRVRRTNQFLAFLYKVQNLFTKDTRKILIDEIVPVIFDGLKSNLSDD
jgi:hypothetical protein